MGFKNNMLNPPLVFGCWVGFKGTRFSFAGFLEDLLCYWVEPGLLSKSATLPTYWQGLSRVQVNRASNLKSRDWKYLTISNRIRGKNKSQADILKWAGVCTGQQVAWGIGWSNFYIQMAGHDTQTDSNMSLYHLHLQQNNAIINSTESNGF